MNEKKVKVNNEEKLKYVDIMDYYDLKGNRC